MVREPLEQFVRLIQRPDPTAAAATIRRALGGLVRPHTTHPPWLLPHQREGLDRVRGIMEHFRGACLSDATGLGKTYISLALTTDYDNATVLAPAAVLPQWNDHATRLNLPVQLQSHESLSHGRPVHHAPLIVVDEAHRFRNPATIRYDQLSRAVGNAHVLLVTATPVVNSMEDAVALLQLFLADHDLALHGVRSIARSAECAEGALASAMRLLTVARTWHTVASLPSMNRPAVQDQPVLRVPPLRAEAMTDVLARINALRFPTFGREPVAAALLRNHLLRRLTSSAESAIETLRRHRNYLDRAEAAVRRGEPLGRRDARRLFAGWDALQLDLLDDMFTGAPPLDADACRLERNRIDALIARLDTERHDSPKREKLRRVISRPSSTALVFTTSVATAHALAEHAGWKHVAVASGQGARIASGRMDVQSVLDLFAPSARGKRTPHERDRISTLVATDLVSEGINLQDADTVVHYDIPWTAVRLQQRLGRVVRFGSRHAVAQTWWFAPAAEIETQLNISERVLAKANLAHRVVGVPSSAIGTSEIPSTRDALERMATFGDWPPGEPGCAVVRGGAVAVLAVEWRVGDRRVPEVLVLNGGEWVVDSQSQARVINTLLAARPSTRRTDLQSIQGMLLRCVRARIVAARRGPVDSTHRRLTRRLIARARAEGRARNQVALDALNQILNRLAAGLPAGGLRSLEAVLDSLAPQETGQWCSQWPVREEPSFGVRLLGALVGDETVSCCKT